MSINFNYSGGLNMEKYVDLHCHSKYSDGKYSVEELIVLAKLNDVDFGTKTVVVNLDINKNGNISNVTIKRSSGNTVLDNKVKDCIRKSSPLPAFPSSYAKTMINVDYSVSKISSGVSVTNEN